MRKNNERKKIVLLGMSYARQWQLHIPNHIEFLNKGVEGDITDRMVERFDSDVLQQKPDYVIIWGFSNDITTGIRSHIEDTLRNIQKNFTLMVDMAKRQDIVPILATQITISYRKNLLEWCLIPMARILRKKSYTDFTNHYIIRMNNWLREYARRQELPLLDLEPLLTNRWGFRKWRFTQQDGSHVSEAGYQKLEKFTLTLLRDLKITK